MEDDGAAAGCLMEVRQRWYTQLDAVRTLSDRGWPDRQLGGPPLGELFHASS